MCSQDTEMPAVGFQREMPTHLASQCPQALCCHPGQHLSRPPMCLSPPWADSCKGEHCLPIVYLQQGTPDDHSLCILAEWREERGTSEIIPDITLWQGQKPRKFSSFSEAMITCLHLCCFQIFHLTFSSGMTENITPRC